VENRLFSKGGQRQNLLDLERKTAHFIGQLLFRAHVEMDVLALPSSLPLPVLGRLGRRVRMCNLWLHISQATSAKEDRQSTEVISKLLMEKI